jgi:diguanylate cyclase (GGDEF)-like protein
MTCTDVVLGTYRVAAPYRPQLYLLGLGLVALACSDTVYAYLINGGAAEIPPLVNVGFVAAPTLICVAAVTRAPADGQTQAAGVTPRPVGGWTHLLLPYLTGGVAALVIFLQISLSAASDRPVVYFAGTIVALLVTRQMITSADNTRLLRQSLETQQRATFQALHDPVTGLPNRTLFADLLAQAVDRHQRDGQHVSLFYIDLDDFKLVNDSLGHDAGDRALRLVGERLASCVRDEGITARLGGDEFAVLLGDVTDAPTTRGSIEAPEVVGDRILAALRQPVAIDKRLVTISASVGVASSDTYASAPDPDTLLRHADAAMYLAKRSGKRTLIHHQAAATDGEPHPELPNMLAEALAGDPMRAGFAVAYQPIVRIEDETTVAVEALARWSHPVTGTVGPDVFVPLAERAGLVAAVDNFVLDRACHDAEAITEYYGRPVDIHVNISGARLGQPELPTAVAAALRRHSLAPSRLVVEITETAHIGDLDAARAGATQLRRLGVRVALDDFGAGFNAFAQLHVLPVDIVKLDHELTRLDIDPPRARAMCRAIVSICADVGVTVIAEGVQTQAQSDALVRLGVTVAQGHLYGPPTSLPELIAPDSGLKLSQTLTWASVRHVILPHPNPPQGTNRAA